MTTTVVNLYKESYDVYIGRPGKGKSGYFGNPFSLTKESDRELVLQQYKDYFYERLSTDAQFKTAIHELKDKRLGCFCAPKLCHGNVIAQYLDTEFK